MIAILWFLGGLALVAAISFGAARLFQAKSKKDIPSHPDHLPKDWESVMPKEKRKSNKSFSKSAGPSFKKVGVKSSSSNRDRKKLW